MSAAPEKQSAAPPTAAEPPREKPTSARFPRKTLILTVALLAVNLGGAHLLDALGLVEGLLSPSGGRLLLLVPLAAAYYVARILALFLAPGLLAGALLEWLWERRTSGRRAIE